MNTFRVSTAFARFACAATIAALATAACGDGAQPLDVSADASQRGPYLAGEEPIELRLSSSDELQIGVLADYKAFMRQSDGNTCIGLRAPAGDVSTLCKETARWDSFAELFVGDDSDDPDEISGPGVMLGVVTAEVDRLEVTYGTKVFDVTTSALKDAPTVRFFLFEAPTGFPGLIEGFSSNGEKVLVDNPRPDKT